MNERRMNEWRIEAPRAGWESRLFLNGEDLGALQITGYRLEATSSGHTQLTLTLVPQRVMVVSDPELHLIVGDRRFRVIEETEGDLDDGFFGERRDDGPARRANGEAHQGL